jgi:hypothetical protein
VTTISRERNRRTEAAHVPLLVVSLVVLSEIIRIEGDDAAIPFLGRRQPIAEVAGIGIGGEALAEVFFTGQNGTGEQESGGSEG